MKINVRHATKSPGTYYPFSFTSQASELDMRGVDEVRGAVQVDGAFYYTGESFVIAGKIAVSMVLVCDRCCASYPYEAVIPFEEEYAQTVDPLYPDRCIFDGESIDLAEVVEENILLNLPMKRLCKADCKGLCPSCGINRNLESCQCN